MGGASSPIRGFSCSFSSFNCLSRPGFCSRGFDVVSVGVPWVVIWVGGFRLLQKARVFGVLNPLSFVCCRNVVLFRFATGVICVLVFIISRRAYLFNLI